MNHFHDEAHDKTRCGDLSGVMARECSANEWVSCSDCLDLLTSEEQAAQGYKDGRHMTTPEVGDRVHNHRPYAPTCNERMTPDGLRGACLNDDGTDRSPTPEVGGFGEGLVGVLAGTGVTANTWQSAARRLADENRLLREALGRVREWAESMDAEDTIWVQDYVEDMIGPLSDALRADLRAEQARNASAEGERIERRSEGRK